MTYIALSTPKVNHQRCGEECRHEFAELYRRICTSTNQTRVNVEPMSDNLASNHRAVAMCSVHTQRSKHQDVSKYGPGINSRIRRWGISRLPLSRSSRVSLGGKALRPSTRSCGTGTIARWMIFGVIRHVAMAVHQERVKLFQEPGRIRLPFVLNPLCALAGPAPDTEPNIKE